MKKLDQATKERIKNEALNSDDDISDPIERQKYIDGYIAGATIWAEQLKQEKNKIVDDCIYTFAEWLTDPLATPKELTDKLESFKLLNTKE